MGRKAHLPDVFHPLLRSAHRPDDCPNCGATFTLESLTAVKAKALRPEKVKPQPVDIEDLPEIDADDADRGR